MRIRTHLTILFSIMTAAILLVFAAIIYFSAKEDREKEFYAVLKKEAITKANLFFNAKVEVKTLQSIYRNNRKVLNEVEVAIYDVNFKLLYHDAVDLDFVKETPEMVKEIYQKGEKRFYQQDWQVIGLRYTYEKKSYIITATSYDQYGYSKLNNLLHNIIFVFTLSILFIYAAGRYFSRKAFEPVKEMTDQMKNITATNLDLRLNDNENKDELSELANTFNEMLNRLENSFDAQKQFVSNISHELRTPLAAIITELELSITKNREISEYQLAIQSALSDARKLARLSNSLLDFAKASYDPSEIAFKQVRIDEVLLDARQQLQRANLEYKVDIHFEQEFEDDSEISVKGNEYLLKTAFVNLFENGCKFSENRQSMVSVSFDRKKIILKFSDKGIGIPLNDIKNIFTPFYRGDNKKYAEGNGIGLSLTHKIIQLHNGTITAVSTPSKGTTFTIILESL
ncbi:HAMP domain-containing sensor histidine kinase [Flavobacterium sp. B183]|uniref:HAMP domain-containing sensor histidine kinase n=1 Tax=Flavobacterium sp. B183 TaxID=907046 RepID=UPI00201E97AB|nr:HAMP domain-containing sensor histidine kinase [Flavobacterium sp. B183]URC14801.1 HAMP domain-containing histidine kinase [Flavobacterium sp. B183]